MNSYLKGEGMWLKMERKLKKKTSDAPIAALFLAPTFLLIICITVIPIVMAFNTSLHITDYANIGEFVGLDNYAKVLGSAEGWNSIFNSIIYVLLSLVLVMPLGVGIGTLLNRKIKGIGVMRTLIIIPWVLSQTVTALLWKWILNGNYGPITYLVYLITGSKPDFFNSDIPAKLTVVFANVWNTLPIVIILTLAALQTIPKEVYEAAKVDGASGWRIYTRITLPLIKSTLITALVMQSMEYFNMVTLIYVLTAGGPLGATQTLSVAAFQQGFDYWHMDIGATYSIIIFLLNIVFSLCYIRLMKTSDD